MIIKTREEMLEWREQLLAKVNMDAERLLELGRTYQLRVDEQRVYETVHAIDYLLAEDD